MNTDCRGRTPCVLPPSLAFDAPCVLPPSGRGASETLRIARDEVRATGDAPDAVEAFRALAVALVSL